MIRDISPLAKLERLEHIDVGDTKIMSSDRVMSKYFDISLFDEENYSDIYLGKKFEIDAVFGDFNLEVPVKISRLEEQGWRLADGNEYDKQYVYDNEPIEQGKLKGVKFTSKTVKDNNNEFTSIFIPAAGYCGESLLNGIGADGELWSSSLDGSSDDYARNLYFYYDGDVIEYSNSRCCGRSVRGVQA